MDHSGAEVWVPARAAGRPEGAVVTAAAAALPAHTFLAVAKTAHHVSGIPDESCVGRGGDVGPREAVEGVRHLIELGPTLSKVLLINHLRHILD